jgi:hypothetical protein
VDDRFEIGPHTTSFRTFDGENVVLQVVTTLRSPKSTDDWKVEPYRGLQEKIEAYKTAHQGIEIKIDFIDFRDVSSGRGSHGE